MISTHTPILDPRFNNLSAQAKLEEKKARILIKLRGYRLIKRDEQKNAISFTVKMPREKKTALIWAIPAQGTVGVQYINQLKKAMNTAEVERGIIITSGRYTHAAKVNAKKKGIELIPRILQSFDIFEHELVPKHELLQLEERQKVLAEYRVQPYQLPRITTSDPAAKVIGAKPGDIVRIIRKSPTAGEYVSYRYVVEG
ncbi:DNA-directed RNA polymerase subunit H [Candidatus Bathyarchaeota archaeon]|nr:DNA-directed RNA polymerase subunit H [Candidatus Bathyarchaeota archaeon]